MHLNGFILIKLKNTRETISRDSNGESCPPCGGDSGMTMGDSFAVYSDDYCGSMCWPVDRPATHAAAGAAARGGFVWGILLRLDWEPLREPALDHGSGQTRMPPQERRHEEVFVWGILLRLDWEPLREHVLAGQTRMPPQESGTRRFLFGGMPPLREHGLAGGPAIRGVFNLRASPPPRKKTRRSRDKSQDRRALLSP